MGTMTPLSNRDCAQLLKEWGFAEAGFKGGHMIMELEGRHVQISAPGRAAPTPYKALRKAARIVGVSLKDFLGGPRRTKESNLGIEIPDAEPELEVEIVTATATVEQDIYTCQECGKSDFRTLNGFKGHMRSHEIIRCPGCGQKVIRSGLGSHLRKCGVGKRGRGRPRKPIAEALETKATGRNLDVEMPEPLVLDNEPDFPSVEDFKITGRLNTSVVVVDDDSDTALLQAFLPGTVVTPDLSAVFDQWLEATRALFAAVAQSNS